LDKDNKDYNDEIFYNHFEDLSVFEEIEDNNNEDDTDDEIIKSIIKNDLDLNIEEIKSVNDENDYNKLNENMEDIIPISKVREMDDNIAEPLEEV
jgi:hypothetical protein